MPNEELLLENKVWVRLTSACNARCLFCLDGSNQNGNLLPAKEVRAKLKAGLLKGKKNRAILSGGEASIHPQFSDLIRCAKNMGYDRVQTITNGIRFGDQQFCDTCIQSGLGEITFSLHGHTAKLHDLLTGIPGSFDQALIGLRYIKKKYPEIIVNIDICVNKINVKYLAEIIKFFLRKGIFEFDLLQIIPFGRAFGANRKQLFYEPKRAYPYLRKAWALARLPGTHIFTNRFPPEALEGYEELIQDHNKIAGEILNESRPSYEAAFRQKTYPYCRGETCQHCFLQQFCDTLNQRKSSSPLRIKLLDLKGTTKKLNPKRTYRLRGYRLISELRKDWGETAGQFKQKIQQISDNKIKTYNLPLCLNPQNQGFDGPADYPNQTMNLEKLVKIYITDLYRKKSWRCEKCKHFQNCAGIHISFLRAYGFHILKPSP